MTTNTPPEREALKMERNDDMVRRLGRVGGFAPGSYMCKCADCGVTFSGDKRALHCLPCAIEGLARPHSNTKAEEPVAEVEPMPGSNGGFTMAVFMASDVPVGTKLYAAPQAPDSAASDTGAEEDQANHNCLAKRRPGEPMFITLGRDPDGHNMVRQWAERRLAAGGDPEHCQMAFATANRMEVYATDPANRPTSAPDASAYPPLRAPTAADADKGGVVDECDLIWLESLRNSLNPNSDDREIFNGQSRGERIDRILATLQAEASAPVVTEEAVKPARVDITEETLSRARVEMLELVAASIEALKHDGRDGREAAINMLERIIGLNTGGGNVG